MNKIRSMARTRWDAMPHDLKERILNNVWCSSCSDGVTLVEISYEDLESGELLLKGKCGNCGGPVARLLEGD